LASEGKGKDDLTLNNKQHEFSLALQKKEEN